MRIVHNLNSASQAIPFAVLVRVLTNVILFLPAGATAVYLVTAVANKHLSALWARSFLCQLRFIRFLVIICLAAFFTAEDSDAGAVRVVLNRLAAIRAIPLAEFLRVFSDIGLREPTSTAATLLIPAAWLKDFPTAQTRLFFVCQPTTPCSRTLYHVVAIDGRCLCF